VASTLIILALIIQSDMRIEPKCMAVFRHPVEIAAKPVCEFDIRSVAYKYWTMICVNEC